MRGFVLVIAGPPGAGKSSVASNLAASSTNGVDIHADYFWHLIRTGRLEPWLPEAHAQNATVIDAVAAAASMYAIGGYEVFVDGVIGPWFIDRFIDASRIAATSLHYVVLRPSDDACLRRARERPPADDRADPLRASRPIRDLCAQFRNLDAYEPHAIDSSSETLDATVARVDRRLRSGELQVV